MCSKQNNTTDDKGQQAPNEIDIESRLQQYANVNIVTSLDRIGLVLGYLAQCDYAIGNSSADIGPDGSFGRGYLLEMLSDGVNNFAKTFEQTEIMYLQQQSKHNEQRQHIERVQTQNQSLLGLVNQYQQLTHKQGQQQNEKQQPQEQYNHLIQQLNQLNTQLTQLQ